MARARGGHLATVRGCAHGPDFWAQSDPESSVWRCVVLTPQGSDCAPEQSQGKRSGRTAAHAPARDLVTGPLFPDGFPSRWESVWATSTAQEVPAQSCGSTPQAAGLPCADTGVFKSVAGGSLGSGWGQPGKWMVLPAGPLRAWALGGLRGQAGGPEDPVRSLPSVVPLVAFGPLVPRPSARTWS